MAFPEGSRPQDPDTRLAQIQTDIQEYLETSLADTPGAEDTITYCYRGHELYKTVIAAHLAKKDPSHATVFQTALAQELAKTNAERSIQDAHTKSGGRATFPVPSRIDTQWRGKSLETQGIIVDMAYAFPSLTRYEYAWMLHDPNQLTPPLRNPNEFDRTVGRYITQNRRTWQFRQLSELQPGHVLLRMASLLSVEYIAKQEARRSIRNELRPFSPGMAVAKLPPEDPLLAARYARVRLDRSLQHIGTLKTVKAIKAIVQKKYAITDDMLSVVSDVIFFSRGSLPTGQRTMLIEPVIQTIAEAEKQYDAADKGDETKQAHAQAMREATYAQAEEQIGFLVTHFSDCFPKWRRGEHEGTSYERIEDLLDGLLQTTHDPLRYFPPAYHNRIRPFIENITERKIQEMLEMRMQEEQIRQQRVASRLLIKTLAVVSRNDAQTAGDKRIHNPEEEISKQNPLSLNYMLSIYSFSAIHNNASIIAIATQENDQGVSTHLGRMNYSSVTEKDEVDFSQKPIDGIFANILYANRITVHEVIEAFTLLQRAGELRPEDSPALLLHRGLAQVIHRLTTSLYQDVRISEEHVPAQKLRIIREFLEQFPQ